MNPTLARAWVIKCRDGGRESSRIGKRKPRVFLIELVWHDAPDPERCAQAPDPPDCALPGRGASSQPLREPRLPGETGGGGVAGPLSAMTGRQGSQLANGILPIARLRRCTAGLSCWPCHALAQGHSKLSICNMLAPARGCPTHWVDRLAHFGDFCSRKAAEIGVLTDDSLVRGKINAPNDPGSTRIRRPKKGPGELRFHVSAAR
jgi:hypothetical protein